MRMDELVEAVSLLDEMTNFVLSGLVILNVVDPSVLKSNQAVKGLDLDFQ